MSPVPIAAVPDRVQQGSPNNMLHKAPGIWSLLRWHWGACAGVTSVVIVILTAVTLYIVVIALIVIVILVTDEPADQELADFESSQGTPHPFECPVARLVVSTLRATL